MPSQGRIEAVAIVTGASRGIGRAAALALARAGWKVALVARSEGALAAVAREAKLAGAAAAVCPADISEREAAEEAVARASGELGPPAALVNNAAVVGPVGFAHSSDPTEWKKAVDINLIGAFYMARAALAKMVEQGQGTILNIVSGMGLRVFPRFSAYSVSKAGLIHLTRVLAEETGSSGITINALDPGLVDTSMQEDLAAMPQDALGPEMSASLGEYRRLNLFKPPEQVGNWIAAFLAGRARQINGEVGTMAEFEARHGIPASPRR